jgi:peptide/nickel transport system substrate-binding protein
VFWVVAVVAITALGLPFDANGVATARTPSDRLMPGGGHKHRRYPQRLLGAYSSFPDYLDPQLSYTLEGWTAMYDTYIPLLTYRHANGKAGSEVIPGLAKDLPKITDGGRAYTLFLRKGLRYSNGQRVKASDFRFAVERLLRLNSGGSSFYTDIDGAERFQKAKRGSISGIVTSNKTGRIVIHLVKPRGTFTDELGLMFVAPVPPSTPATDQTSKPPPATGPYVITRSQPGKGWFYARNPEWGLNNAKLMPRLPSGHVDQIHMVVVRNGSTQVNEVEQGKLDWIFSPPPVNRFAEVKRKYQGTQFRVEPNLSTYYFWMNTSTPPFNDLKVRQAVNYAVDPSVLRKIYANQLAPSQQILPPGMPGYKKFELYPHDMAKAQQLVAEANPSDRNITVWTDDEAPTYEATAYYRDLLQKLGFSAHLKTVYTDNYLTVIGRLSTPNLDTGWGDWFEDYPHPSDFFDPLFGPGIRPTNNSNFAQINIPTLNQKITRLDEERGPIQESNYAALDKSFMEQAPWAPFGNLTLSTFVSKTINLNKVVWNPTFGDDLTSLQFK